MPGSLINARRMHAHQHLTLAGDRLVDLRESQNVDGAVGVPNDRLHLRSIFIFWAHLGLKDHSPVMIAFAERLRHSSSGRYGEAARQAKSWTRRRRPLQHVRCLDWLQTMEPYGARGCIRWQRSQTARRENGGNKRKSLPPVASRHE